MAGIARFPQVVGRLVDLVIRVVVIVVRVHHRPGRRGRWVFEPATRHWGARAGTRAAVFAGMASARGVHHQTLVSNAHASND